MSGRLQVKRLPVTAFKRNGMQDQEHSKLLGTTNFLSRCPRDVSIELSSCSKTVKACNPCKVPPCGDNCDSILGCRVFRKRPINVALEDLLD